MLEASQSPTEVNKVLAAPGAVKKEVTCQEHELEPVSNGILIVDVPSAVSSLQSSSEKERFKEDTSSLGSPRTESVSSEETELPEPPEMKQTVGSTCRETDTLDLAKQVAVERKQEILAYTEAFCTSSPEVTSDQIGGGTSSSTVKEVCNDQEITEEGLEVISDLPRDMSSLEHQTMRSTKISGSEQEQKLELLNPVTVNQEPVDKILRKQYVLDLNKDASLLDLNAIKDLVAVNSTSPPLDVFTSNYIPDLPTSRLSFNGEMGAFHAASWRISDGQKIYYETKGKAKVIDFEIVIDDDDDLLREGLDLNLNDFAYKDLPSSQNEDKFVNGASSSSLRENSLRDFDLNGRPCFFDATGCSSLRKSSSSTSSSIYSSHTQVNDSVVTLMGSILGTKSKENLNQLHTFLPTTGMSLESPETTTTFISNLPNECLGVPNSFAPGDCSGASSSEHVFPLGFSPGASSSSSGLGSSNPLDLSIGLTSVTSPENVNYKQLVIPVRGGSLEMQNSTATLSLAFGIAQKRKEPEGGCEPHCSNNKQMMRWL